jgi:hypothetical protein
METEGVEVADDRLEDLLDAMDRQAAWPADVNTLLAETVDEPYAVSAVSGANTMPTLVEDILDDAHDVSAAASPSVPLIKPRNDGLTRMQACLVAGNHRENVFVMLDTGSTIDAVSAAVATQFQAAGCVLRSSNVSLRMANGDRASASAKLDAELHVKLDANRKFSMPLALVVLPDLSEDVLIGNASIQSAGLMSLHVPRPLNLTTALDEPEESPATSLPVVYDDFCLRRELEKEVLHYADVFGPIHPEGALVRPHPSLVFFGSFCRRQYEA